MVDENTSWVTRNSAEGNRCPPSPALPGIDRVRASCYTQPKRESSYAHSGQYLVRSGAASRDRTLRCSTCPRSATNGSRTGCGVVVSRRLVSPAAQALASTTEISGTDRDNNDGGNFALAPMVQTCEILSDSVERKSPCPVALYARLVPRAAIPDSPRHALP
jgi:hypothetical protein